MRIIREIMRCYNIKIGKVATSIARDQDFLPDTVCMIQKEDAPPPLTSGQRAHEPRCTRADDNHIKFFCTYQSLFSSEFGLAKDMTMNNHNTVDKDW